MTVSVYTAASLFQWVQLTPGATYELSADLAGDGRAKLLLGVKWDSYAEGPSQSLNYTYGVRTLKVKFTVPQGSGKVGIYMQARGASAVRNWATADNFKLVRVNN
jgi:hypothetical protein